jgi:hypothetical protein
MPAKALDRNRLRHLLEMVLLALEGPDDGSIREAIQTLYRALKQK